MAHRTPLPPLPSPLEVRQERKSFDAAMAALEAILDPSPQFLADPRPEYLRALPSIPSAISDLLARY